MPQVTRADHLQPMEKIQINSPYCHTCLPQFQSKINYAYKTGPCASSMSPLTEPAMKWESPSHIQTSPQTTSTTTPTKRTYHPPYQKFHVLIPLFIHLAECMWQSHLQTTLALTKPSSLPSLVSETQSTMVRSTLATLKRSSELLKHCDTEACPAKMTRWQLLLCNSTKFSNWNLNLQLAHHLPITSPFQHCPYTTTCKSQQVLHPPEPESALWPVDQLHPSNHIPKVKGVQGLKLAEWEQEYHKFHRGFVSELSCCLQAQQEELKCHLP